MKRGLQLVGGLTGWPQAKYILSDKESCGAFLQEADVGLIRAEWPSLDLDGLRQAKETLKFFFQKKRQRQITSDGMLVMHIHSILMQYSKVVVVFGCFWFVRFDLGFSADHLQILWRACSIAVIFWLLTHSSDSVDLHLSSGGSTTCDDLSCHCPGDKKQIMRFAKLGRCKNPRW